MKPLVLVEHPEGGRYREVFRSATVVSTPCGKDRTAITHIYFSLGPGEVSRFHRVASDEVWNLYRGPGLRLFTWNGEDEPPTCITLSEETECFCHVVPAGTWQAAAPVSATVLVGCSVAPGFEFSDFELISPGSSEAAQLRSIDPDLSLYIDP